MSKPDVTAELSIRAILARLFNEAVAEDWYYLRIDWLKERGWIGFPVPDDNYYYDWETDNEVRALALTLERRGITRVIAGNLDYRPEDAEFAWTGDASFDGLMAFTEALGVYYFLLTDEQVNFVVLCTKDEYHVIAGPPDFVCEVLGQDFEGSKAAFIEHARTAWSGSDEDRLLDILDEYEDLLAASGFVLSTPKKERRRTTWHISKREKGSTKEVERIALDRHFGLVSLQDSFDREPGDLMKGETQIHRENLKYAWFPLDKKAFDFEAFDYYLVSHDDRLRHQPG